MSVCVCGTEAEGVVKAFLSLASSSTYIFLPPGLLYLSNLTWRSVEYEQACGVERGQY
jgi:hypothetical protein